MAKYKFYLLLTVACGLIQSSSVCSYKISDNYRKRLIASATGMPETQVGKARAEETDDDYLEDRPLYPERAIDFNVQLIDLLTQNAPKYGEFDIPEDLEPYGEWLRFGINMYIPIDSGRSPDTIQTTAISLLNPNSRDMWEKSNVRKDFNIYLFKAWSHNQRYKTIENVICFGLGPIHIESDEESPDNLPRTDPGLNRYRVFLAFDITRMLKVNFQLKSIQLIFHDTKDECQYRELIQELADKQEQKISFLDTCEAIRKVNGNTLVLAHGIPREGLPLRSIILDKTEKYGGPAGILCEKIPDIKTIEDEATTAAKEIASTEKTSKEKLRDPPTKRMAHQREKYGMKPMCRIDKWEVTMYLKSHGSSRRK
ncbi:hypothetical protein J4E93_008034 [Alternaria ventricosa]|uniref:uncharacterized protein n=1 Tax=Alternaria ventricosa TaxID=1187951 RepID=UPI0020C272CC|nr:uncharacterized protein J4E93_008034 [Alternaria ventricosa]KAI4641156.1 hypothetical protein J4E93_008034 [Alternaria ventricosa]